MRDMPLFFFERYGADATRVLRHAMLLRAAAYLKLLLMLFRFRYYAAFDTRA